MKNKWIKYFIQWLWSTELKLKLFRETLRNYCPHNSTISDGLTLSCKDCGKEIKRRFQNEN